MSMSATSFKTLASMSLLLLSLALASGCAEEVDYDGEEPSTEVPEGGEPGRSPDPDAEPDDFPDGDDFPDDEPEVDDILEDEPTQVEPEVEPERDGDPSALPCEVEQLKACACDNDTAGVSQCVVDGDASAWGECACDERWMGLEFAQAEELMMGHWVGIGDSPWTGPYPVEVTFRPDGTYFARCLVDETPRGECRALYWSHDIESPELTWELVDIFANDRMTGNIHRVPPRGESAIRMNFDRLAFSLEGDGLFFEVWPMDRDVAGPVTLHLIRM